MIDQLRHAWTSYHRRSFSQMLKARNPDLYKWVIDNTDDSFTSFVERAFWLLNPVNLTCEYGNRKKFSPQKDRYGFCGNAGDCKCHRDAVQLRSNETSVFGTSAFLEARATTWENKYGGNPQKLESYRQSAASRNKGKKHTKVAKEKYLTVGYHQVVDRLSDKLKPLFTPDEYSGSSRKHKYKWECVTCNSIIEGHVDYGSVPHCTICYPKVVSSGEKELREFIKSLGVSQTYNRKDIIPPLELDIYIDHPKVAIEFNGIYWHSSYYKEQYYHVDKYLLCKDKGIHLIQIFEDEWDLKKDIIKSRIRNILGKSNVTYARRLTVQTVPPTDAVAFLNKHHIQGSAQSTINIGLYDNTDLYAIMTFGFSRYDKSAEYELVRFCSKDTVVGAAGKLFTHFVRLYNPRSVISYADRCWSNGNLYKQLGFIDVTPDSRNVGYFYVKNGVRYHRSSFTKKRLVEQGADPLKTEFEIMENNGYLRIYNCGNYKFRWGT